jgi:orotidine-5'-phosphate decarboxylase
LTLFIKEGPSILSRIGKMVGDRIFLDLKFHDIPETLRSVSAALMSLSDKVRFVTVHASEGETAVRAAVNAMKRPTRVLGVTVLTSLSETDLRALGFQQTVQERVLALSRIAKNAGCAGVVSSANEAMAVKKEMGKDFIVVTPGIRPKWSALSGDDQQRITTPGEAITNGADYIVVGRPISRAKDPVEAAEKIAQEIEEATRGQKTG